MVGVSFKGRLGNQLFQYCFFHYLKSRRKGVFFFFVNPHHAYLSKYFDLGSYYNFILGSKIYSLLSRVACRLIRFKQIFIHNFFAPKPVDVVNHAIYNGYYQSDWYLNQLNHPPKIKVKKKFRDEFDRMYGELFLKNRVVVVHIRRTDYLSYGKRDISIPIGFFKEQLASVSDLDQCKVIFVSDDIDYVKEQFGEHVNYIFSLNSEIIDFQLIQNADVAIISNSPFAWWAGYLSIRENNTVIGPSNWMGFSIGREHPRGIMTDKFLWRPVHNG